ncbi:MAG TPA: carboxypeptidase regulatory-like domain-containing protein, partial [Kofleriaceae bacterium]|nr:carboxypeptidase regulatory-like domain-containing protein [Kofleriaceae bacterium]
TTAAAGTTNLELAVGQGAILRGTVTSAVDGSPVKWARVMREARDGGASTEPSNAGTVTREDGSFELTGIPAGPLAIRIGADGFNVRIEGGMTASDGDELGPLALQLTPLSGDTPAIELVGIGVALGADGDTLLVQRVIDGSGAKAAGIVTGDRITAVDGTPVTDIGLDGAIAKIRGVAGTAVAITLQRGEGQVTLQVVRSKIKA